MTKGMKVRHADSFRVKFWKKSIEDDRIAVMKTNCAFPSSADGIEINLLKSFSACQSVCIEDHRCSAFSYNVIDGKCVLPHRANRVEKILGPLNLNYLFLLRSPIYSSSANANCAVVVTRVWQADGDANCEFNKGIDICSFRVGYYKERLNSDGLPFYRCISRHLQKLQDTAKIDT
jgi:hypothetical protein